MFGPKTDTPLRLRILTLGTALWGFTLLVPRLHLGAPAAPSPRLEMALFTLPLLMLLVGTVRRSVVTLILGVPLALTPALLVDPRLVGPQVYGFAAYLVTAIVFAAYLLVAATAGHDRERRTPSPRPSRRARARVSLSLGVPTLALLFLVWWAAFDPALVWRAGDPSEAAAARPYGRTLPALLLLMVWLSVMAGPLRRALPRVRRPGPSSAERAG